MSVVSGAVGRRRLLAVPHGRDLRLGRSSPPCSPTATCGARGSTVPRPTSSCSCRPRAASIMASANDLIVMFLGLEILSIAVYVLAGMHLRRHRVGRGGDQVLRARRLLVGVLPLRHRARLRRHRHHEPGRRSPTSWPPPRLADDGLLLAGFGLLLVGFGFKVAAVPFHSWAPDVYQGSPSPVVVVHGLGREGRRLRRAAPGVRRRPSATYRLDWQPIVYVLAVADAAGRRRARRRADRREADARLLVDQPRRVHPGRRQAASADGVAGALFYLAAYTFMVAGTFGVVTWSAAGATATTTSSDYRGLSRREPLLAFAFTVFLLAQAGVPAHLGLLRQVLRDRRRRRGPLVLAGPGRHALRGHLGLPLPAHRAGHVRRPGRRGGGRRARATRPPRPGCGCRSPPRSPSSSRWSPPSASASSPTPSPTTAARRHPRARRHADRPSR